MLRMIRTRAWHLGPVPAREPITWAIGVGPFCLLSYSTGPVTRPLPRRDRKRIARDAAKKVTLRLRRVV